MESSHTTPPDSAVQSLLFNTIFRSDYLYWSVTRMFESSLLAPLGVPADVQAAMTQDRPFGPPVAGPSALPTGRLR